MNNLFNLIIDWAEVWALLIPICVFFYKKKISSLLKPVVWYVFIALFLNLAQDIIWKYKIELKLTGFLYNNPFVYNTHSIERFALFSLFFIRLKQPILSRIKTILPFVFFLFIIINFSVYQSFTEFSSRTLGTETAFLLLYCLLYYLNLLNQDTTIAFKHLPDFWVVTGLSIYVVINFPIFLFYRALSNQFEKFAIDIWNVHNITYIIFCVFLARAFYVSKN